MAGVYSYENLGRPWAMNVSSKAMNGRRGEDSVRVLAEPLGKAVLGLLRLLPLSAQQNQTPLIGRVTREEIINPRYKTIDENEKHISQLVGDIIHQVDMIIPSHNCPANATL